MACVLGSGTKRRVSTTVTCWSDNTPGTRKVIPVGRYSADKYRPRADTTKSRVYFWGKPEVTLGLLL